MRVFVLPAALVVTALSLLLAEPPSVQACPPGAWLPSYGGYAYGWYHPVYPGYSGGYYPVYASGPQAPGVTQTRSYYYAPETPGASSAAAPAYYPAPAPLAPPVYGGSYNTGPSRSSAAGVDNSPTFDRWKPDSSDPFYHSEQ